MLQAKFCNAVSALYCHQYHSGYFSPLIVKPQFHIFLFALLLHIFLLRLFWFTGKIVVEILQRLMYNAVKKRLNRGAQCYLKESIRVHAVTAVTAPKLTKLLCFVPNGELFLRRKPAESSPMTHVKEYLQNKRHWTLLNILRKIFHSN